MLQFGLRGLFAATLVAGFIVWPIRDFGFAGLCLSLGSSLGAAVSYARFRRVEWLLAGGLYGIWAGAVTGMSLRAALRATIGL